MIELLLAIVVLLGIVGLVEYAEHRKIIDSELSRKIPHSATALAYVILAFSIDLKLIAFGAAIHLLGALLAYKFDWFPKARWVKRQTYGEFLFPLAVVLTSLIANNKCIFIAAILNLGIADTMAALIGRRFGRHSYKIYKQTKSFEGTLAFALTSAAITAWVIYFANSGLKASWPVVVWLPLLTAGIESLTPYGIDNLLVPMFVVLVLNSL